MCTLYLRLAFKDIAHILKTSIDTYCTLHLHPFHTFTHNVQHYDNSSLIITIWKGFLVTDMKSFQIKSPYVDKYHHMNAWSERLIFSFSDQDGDWFELFSYGDIIKWWRIWFEMKSQTHFKWWHDQMVTFCVW